MTSAESKISRYILQNPGGDFVAASIATLILVAFIYPFAEDIANEIVTFALVSLIAGVILQVLTLRRHEHDSK